MSMEERIIREGNETGGGHFGEGNVQGVRLPFISFLQKLNHIYIYKVRKIYKNEPFWWKELLLPRTVMSVAVFGNAWHVTMVCGGLYC